MNIRIHDLTFIDLVLAPREIQLDALRLRNQQSIREQSINETVISEEEHWAWISSLCNDSSRKIWVMQAFGKVLGVSSISDINLKDRIATGGLYIDTELQDSGLGVALAHHLLQNGFDAYGLERLEGEVISTNASALQFNKSLGLRVEGIRRSCLVRQDRRLDVYLFGMLRAEWELARPRIEKLLQILKDRKI